MRGHTEVHLAWNRWFWLVTAVLLVKTNISPAAGGGKWIVPEAIAKQRAVTAGKPATKPVGADPLENTWTCYRTSFDLDAVPAWATVRIAADTKYWLWVNGTLAVLDGGLKRGPTRTDGYVDVVDLGPWLKKGKNTIAILSWYFGKEGFSHISSGMPGLYVDSSMLPVHSGASWKAIVHPAFGKTGKPTPNYRLAESNVRFDAGKDITGWMNEGFDDSSWPAASEIGEATSAPWGKMIDRPIPLFKFSQLREYENGKSLPSEGGDQPITGMLPYDAQVTPYLKIDAPAGLTIGIQTDTYKTGDATVRAEYITREGVQEFETPAWMSGFKVLYKIPAGVKVLSLKYRESGYDCGLAGTFHCDDPFFDTIWKKAQRTLYVNMRDNYFDCPDRERAQWWGDIVNDLCEAFYGLEPQANLLVRKGFLELAAWQRPDGVLFAPIPTGNYDQELPPQMLATVGWYGAWTYYLHTGDDETIRRIYPAIKKYLAVWKLGQDGLVIHRPGEWDWEDWGTNIDAPLLDNAWFYLALKSAAGMAKVAGADGDVAGYESQMKSIHAQAYDKTFWKDSEYRSAGYKGDTDERGHAMAVLAGFVPSEHAEGVKAVLMKHRNCSPYMERYVYEAQFTLGDAAGAMQRMKDRYGKIVADWRSTLWEQFQDDGSSYNHGWSGGPLIVLSEYAAGIAPTSPGYDTYEIRPQMGTLKQISTKVGTIKGMLRLSIERDDKHVDMKLTSPPRAKGTVYLPVEGMEVGMVKLNGKVVATPAIEEGRVQFEVGPGAWELEAVAK